MTATLLEPMTADLASPDTDHRDLLRSVENKIGTSTVSKYTYAYDPAGRRTSVVNTGSAFTPEPPNEGLLNTYGYNLRSELTSSHRYQGTDPGSPGDEVTGERRVLAYDNIGNRLSNTEGDIALPGMTYTSNALNQYEQTRGFVEAFTYDADGNTTKTGLAAGDYDDDGDVDGLDFLQFQQCFNGPNRLPKQSWCGESDYDGDGDVDDTDFDLFQACFNGPNQPPACLQNIRPTQYTWDAENRLVAVEPILPQADEKRLTFAYDYMGRRVQKQVFGRNTGNTAWLTTPESDQRFVYDRWNVVETLTPNPQPPHDLMVVHKYTWGLDLSGTLQGAGGIGGLLASEEPQTVGDPKRHWFLYDGNGNVGQLLKYVPGDPPTVTLAAHYEYDPYGNTIRADDVDSSGVVITNPFRFSTKWFDRETGLYYYGYRYYSPRLGRWMSRDPIEERGGTNLYAFVGNRVQNRVDPMGLEYWDYDVDRTVCCKYQSTKVFMAVDTPGSTTRRWMENRTASSVSTTARQVCSCCGDRQLNSNVVLMDASWGKCCTCKMKVFLDGSGLGFSHTYFAVKCPGDNNWTAVDRYPCGSSWIYTPADTARRYFTDAEVSSGANTVYRDSEIDCDTAKKIKDDMERIGGLPRGATGPWLWDCRAWAKGWHDYWRAEGYPPGSGACD